MTVADFESQTRHLGDHRVDALRIICPDRNAEHEEPAGRTACPQNMKKTLTAEQVAGVVGGIPAIGTACKALTKAGWRASIAGNRITVNDEVLAQLKGALFGHAGRVDATWVIYAVTGAPPVWIVGAEQQP